MRNDANCTPDIRRKLIHRGSRFDCEQGIYTGSDGREVRKEYFRHPGAVVVLPLLEDAGAPARVVFIKNFRVSLGRFIWELPAGTLGAGEEPAACAARELIEETGYRAATLTPLCRFHTSPGLSDELMWAFVARGLVLEERRPENDELMTVHPLSLGEAWGLVGTGEMTDCKSICALLLAERCGLLEGTISGA